MMYDRHAGEKEALLATLFRLRSTRGSMKGISTPDNKKKKYQRKKINVSAVMNARSMWRSSLPSYYQQVYRFIYALHVIYVSCL